MTDYNQPQQDFQNQPQVSLPNATAVLILGIIGILGCCCYGSGLILSIIALVLAAKDMKLYKANPFIYTKSSFNNLSAGRICAIIGLVFSVIVVVSVIYFYSIVGWSTFGDQEAMLEAIEKMK